MNISNRLEKLEKNAPAPPSEFCNCESDRTHDVYVHEAGDPAPMRDGKPYNPDEVRICDQCQKQINRSVIIIEGVPGKGVDWERYGVLADVEIATFNISTRKTNANDPF